MEGEGIVLKIMAHLNIGSNIILIIFVNNDDDEGTTDF